jgi:putative lipoic acid-binding regulatory protein
MRGEFDPPKSVENTERNSGIILDSLMKFPGEYPFQIVMKASPGADVASNGTAELEEMCGLLSRVCKGGIDQSRCSVKQRMGGKYLSFTIPVVVGTPELIHQCFAVLEGNPRIIMKY